MGVIIFGTQGSTKTVDAGLFNCPECRREARYKRRSSRQYFSLFFIPVFSTRELGQYIECQICGGTFRTAVLGYKPGPTTEEVFAEFKRAIRLVMILMMTTDGKTGPDEVTAVRDGYRHLTDTELSEADILREAEGRSGGEAELLTRLREIAPFLNEAGKEQVLRAAIFVAGADDLLGKKEMGFVDEIAGALRMTKAHVKGVVQDMIAGSSSPPKFEDRA